MKHSPEPYPKNNFFANVFLSEEDWKTLALLLPFFSEYRYRILLALSILVAVTAATLALPFILKMLVDGLEGEREQLVALPLALVASYTFIRFASVALRQLSDRKSVV